MANVHVETEKGREGKAKSTSTQIEPQRQKAPTVHRGHRLSRLFARDMEHLLHNFGGPLLSRMFAEPWPFAEQLQPWERAEATFFPRANAYEKNNQLIIETDLPGLDKDDVKVEIHENQLVISGSRSEESKSEEGESYYRECSYGNFYRAFALPQGVQADKIHASFRRGVLKVAIPLTAEQQTQARTIQIESEDAASKGKGVKAD